MRGNYSVDRWAFAQNANINEHDCLPSHESFFLDKKPAVHKVAQEVRMSDCVLNAETRLPFLRRPPCFD